MTLAEKLAARPPPRVLVVQTAYLGDTVFTSALFGALAKRFPDGVIDVCVAPRGKDVALAFPGIGHVHVYDKRGADSGIGGLRRIAARLATRQYPLAVLPHRSMRTALLARLAGIPQRIGFAGSPASLLYTARVASSEKTFLRREADLAIALGASPAPMRLVPRPEWIAAARVALGEAAREAIAAICLGSEWATKIWPARHVADLARTLAARGLRPVLLGGARERDLARQIAAAAPCVDTTGNSIGEALAILSLSALAVGGDTGLVHAARALGIPTVAVFGPTPSGVHVFGARERAVSLGLSCSPCSVHGSTRCPLGHHRCLDDLDAAQVALACREVLA
ncbi:MAG TPA: lipopolysaccharide heptosyltransferase II [Myxococcales bacterium]|nr:lipopolysaccharide heptosyltransferase II [Myxococcales bacterium]